MRKKMIQTSRKAVSSVAALALATSGLGYIAFSSPAHADDIAGEAAEQALQRAQEAGAGDFTTFSDPDSEQQEAGNESQLRATLPNGNASPYLSISNNGTDPTNPVIPGIEQCEDLNTDKHCSDYYHHGTVTFTMQQAGPGEKDGKGIQSMYMYMTQPTYGNAGGDILKYRADRVRVYCESTSYGKLLLDEGDGGDYVLTITDEKLEVRFTNSYIHNMNEHKFPYNNYNECYFDPDSVSPRPTNPTGFDTTQEFDDIMDNAVFTVEADVCVPDDVNVPASLQSKSERPSVNIISRTTDAVTGTVITPGSVLAPYELGYGSEEQGDGQVYIPIDVRCMTAHYNAFDGSFNEDYAYRYPSKNCDKDAPQSDGTDGHAPWHKLNDEQIKVSLPVLEFAIATDVSQQQVYGIVNYDVAIKNNTQKTTARNITIHDTDVRNYFEIGIVPKEITVKKNGVTQVLQQGTDWAYDPRRGDLRVNCNTMTIENVSTNPNAEAPVHLTYSVQYGTTAMKSKKATLAQLLERDEGNRSGLREVTVTCENMFKSQEQTGNTAFNLLYPDITTTTQGDVTTPTGGPIHPGEGSAHCTFDFTVMNNVQIDEGASDQDAELQNPRINIKSILYSDASHGLTSAISDRVIDPASIKCTVFDENGTKLTGITVPYENNTVLPNGKIGYVYRLEFDVAAPSSGIVDPTADIVANVALSADNYVKSVESSAGKMVIGEVANSAVIEVEGVQLTASVAVDSSSQLSAAAVSHDVVPVRVIASFGEKFGANFGDEWGGATLTITDNAADSSLDPVKERFKSVAINGRELASDEYTVNGNVLTITGVSIPATTVAGKKTIQVTYTNDLKSGYDYNGAVNNISVASVSTNDIEWARPSSQDPDGADGASTSFTIQTPFLNGKTKLTIPVVETPIEDLVNQEMSTLDDSVEVESKVANVADVIDGETMFQEFNPNEVGAIARDFALKITIDDLTIQMSDGKYRTFTAPQLGVIFDESEPIKVMTEAGNGTKRDVTQNFNVSLSDSKAEIDVTGKEDNEDLSTNAKFYVVYKVQCGSESAIHYDQLAGEDITVSSVLSASNVNPDYYAKSTDDVTIADAEIGVKKVSEKNEVEHGDSNTYTITLVNDPEDKFSANSKAHGVRIKDNIDDFATKLGYAINPDTLKVMVGSTDITNNSSKMTIVWAPKNSGFEIVLREDVMKSKDIVITYDAITENISADAYDNMLSNLVIATAENSKPSVGYDLVSYKGKVLEEPTLEEGGTLPTGGENGPDGSYAENAAGGVNGAAGTGAHGSVSGTGDVILYIVLGVAGVAIIGGVIYLVIRKRQK